MALDQRRLDEAAERGCQIPGCAHDHDKGVIFLHGRCHPGGPIEASYRHGSGLVRIACRVCGKLIAEIAVQE